jgi:[NiFe] hydrogenase assembly HybE family chaperone
MAADKPVRGHDTNPAPLLEQAFSRIERERMQAIPILNHALRVETVGFQEWDGKWIGVLITPWFMNLMLLPGSGGQWPVVSPGTLHAWPLPHARMEFMAGHEESVGEYHFCSLSSAVFQFENQEAAHAVALAAMDTLMSPPKAEAQRAGPVRQLAENIDKPMSKRDFLAGRVFRA